MLKRCLDVVGSLTLLLLLSPLFLVLAVLIRLDSPGPAIYRQQRVGRFGRLFTIYKFRTMVVGTPELATDQMQGKAGSYVTRVGRILRKTSLDELPQLFNILIGDMSFVGPRPALHNQFRLIQLRAERGVHQVRPGLTGWAQVNGRDEISDLEKAELDAYYVRSRSLWLDLVILLRTVSAVFHARNVAH